MYRSRRRLWALILAGCALLIGISVWLNIRGVPGLPADAYVLKSAVLEPGAPFPSPSAVADGNGGYGDGGYNYRGNGDGGLESAGRMPAAAPAELAGMVLAAANETLALYIQPQTTEIAVVVRANGKVWRSSPLDRDADPLAVPAEKERMASPMIVSFRDQQGTLREYTAAGYSIDHEQFTLEKIADGVRITYRLEEASSGIDALPKFITKERFEERILRHLDEGTASYVSLRYLPSEHDENILERNDDELAREIVLNRVLAAFEAAGYTAEDLAYDQAEHGAGGAAAGGASFSIPLEYRLQKDSLLVSVPAGWIEESEGYKISTLELMRYFGAAGADEQGYLFVPDGMGALIHLNNGKLRSEMYGQRIYGPDLNTSSRTKGQVAEAARLPVYGMKTGEDAWLAVIEEGAAIARVHADIGGKKSSYNHVFTSFALRGEDEYVLYKGNNIEIIPRLSEHRYEGDLVVRIYFMSGEEADVAGMAKRYREHLLAGGLLRDAARTGAETREAAVGEAAGGTVLPFFLDILGAVDKRQTFLGVPYYAATPLTTYEQAEQIIDELSSAGVNRIVMRLQGWFNKGFHHRMPDRIRMVRSLGGKEDLQRLNRKLETAGGGLYPDAAFQHVFREEGRFTPAADAARFITRDAARRSYYDLAYNRMDAELGTYHLLSPVKLPYYVERFIDEYADMGLSSVSLRDLGDLLHADYRVDRSVPRENAKRIVVAQLERIADRYPDVLIEGGNDYALPFTDKIVNVPISSSGFDLMDEEVPFYQMVVHGYIDYAGPAVNLSDEQDMRYHTLRCIELGAAPHFLWTYEPASELKYTRFDYMYATYYEDWIAEAAAMYREVSSALAPVRTAVMADYIRHEPDVVEVKYENGISIFVNYNSHPVSVEGHKIGALDYVVTGGER